MARAISSPESILLAKAGQHSRIYLAVKPMEVFYSAQVNQTVLSTDEMISIIYDGGSGNLADVLPGMLLLVGSSPGGAEKGFLRIRKAATSTVIYFGMTSEVVFEDDDYLTVIDDFPLTDKPAASISNLTVIDSAINYSNQHKYMDPIPIMGPMVAVAELVGVSVNLTLDPGVSTVLGSNISAYAHSITGPATVTITNGTTATPTFEFTATGWYRWTLTVTAANTKTATGYRWIFVWSQADSPALISQHAAVDNPTGDADSGIYEFNATLWDHADLDNVAERALVVLFAEDWYGDTKQSIGPIPGWENVITWGWIGGETINWDPKGGSVKFTVRGPAWWLQQIDTQAVTINNIDGSAPTTWDQIEDLDVDKALWHMAHWRSTITAVCDIFLPGDSTPALSLDGGLGTVWDALKNIAKQIGAAPICDRYGRIFIQKDPQLTPAASRSTIPVVMDIGKAKWKDSIQLERRLVKPTSIVDLNALSSSGIATTQLWSRAPGNLSGSYGKSESVDGYIVADQDGANILSGLILAQKNNPQPVVPLSLAGNNRMIDIAPVQYLTQSIARGDTKRGITWSTRKLIPQKVQLVINNKTGAIHPEIEAEAETNGPAGITYIPPATVVNNIPSSPSITDYPNIPTDNTDFPGTTWGGDGGGGGGPVICECADDPFAPYNEYPLSFNQNHVEAGGSIVTAFPCTLRNQAAFNGPSFMEIKASWGGDSFDKVYVTGTNGGDVASGTKLDFYPGKFMFYMPSPVAVTGFKITLNPESGSGNLTFSDMVKHYVNDSIGVYTYLGNGLFEFGVNNNEHCGCNFIMGLTYDGSELPVGRISVLLQWVDGKAHIWGDPPDMNFGLDSWFGAQYAYSLGTKYGWGGTYGAWNMGYLLTGRSHSLSELADPGTSEDRYMIMNFGVQYVSEVCHFQILSIDWWTGGTGNEGEYINLWSKARSPSNCRITNLSASIHNVCA